MKMTFVTFYVSLSEGQLRKVFKFATKFQFKRELLSPPFKQSSSYLEVLFKSIKLTHPTSRRILITDFSTTVDLPEEVEVLRFDIDKEKMVYILDT